jgi:hypothetical protein
MERSVLGSRFDKDQGDDDAPEQQAAINALERVNQPR